MKRLLWLALALMIGISARLGIAQEATPTVTPALAAQMDQLEAATRALRGLDGQSVVREFPTRAETIHYLTDALAVQLPANQADHDLRFYTAFDLLPPNTDLRAAYLRLLGAQVAGYYDSDTKIMHVIPIGQPITNSLNLIEQFIYVHEYTHALQDQFLGLGRLMQNPDVTDSPDRSLATVSLVEGDATNVMSLWLQQVVEKNPLAAFQLLGQSLTAGGLSLPAGTPSILGDELLFPYEQGLTFVTALQRHGGMDAVNAAFAHPPTTATQIMHPQKFIDGWQPVSVTLSDNADTLGSGWQQAWNNTLGEWYLGQYLHTQLEGKVALKAAAGWSGDRFHIYTNTDGKLAWVLRLAWESAADESEFVAAYTDFGAKRFSGQPGADGCWTNPVESLCVKATGQAVIIAQAPDRSGALALLGAQAA